jgi:raffinose/stachyose/melibiose transport system permease protein
MKKNKSFLYICMTAIGLIYMVPFYILTNLALKSPSDISSKWIMPKYLYFDNFISAWKKADLGNAITSNVIITVGALALVVVIGACASYPLARYKTKLNNTIFTIIIACMIVPALTILVPLYKFMVDIHGINTHWAIILVQVTFSLPLTVFLYTGFISSVPKELDEAALIDGCSRVGIFFKIILPLLKPITATVIILNGVTIWNDYQFSIFFLQSSKVRTIPVALSTFFSQFQSDLGYVAAGCIMGMLPLVVLYLLLQKYFIKGMAEGAVKG